MTGRPAPVPAALRALRPGDEETAVRWAADAEFCLAVDWTPDLPAGTVRRHWQAIIADTDPTFRRWGITVAGNLVGYVDLGAMDTHSAELGIALGERTLWGRGVAGQACRQALAWAWARGLGSVTALVHGPNVRSHALMRSLGFTAAGYAPPERYRGEVVAVHRYLIRPPVRPDIRADGPV